MQNKSSDMAIPLLSQLNFTRVGIAFLIKYLLLQNFENKQEHTFNVIQRLFHNKHNFEQNIKAWHEPYTRATGFQFDLKLSPFSVN